MPTFNETKRAMAHLFRAGARNGPDMSGRTEEETKKKEDTVIAMWATILHDLPFSEVENAILLLCGESPFWPHPSEVRKRCPSAQKAIQVQAGEKDAGAGWFGKVAAIAGSYGPNSPNAMIRTPGTLASWQKAPDPWSLGRDRLITALSEGDKAVEAALIAGIAAVGWRAFQDEGLRYRENALRPIFERAFNAAFTAHRLENVKAITTAQPKQLADRPSKEPVHEEDFYDF